MRHPVLHPYYFYENSYFCIDYIINIFLIGTTGVEVPSLKKMKNKDVLLTLPGTLKVRDIKWLSIWCKRFTVNYGEVYIPKSLEIPEKVVSLLMNF